MENKFQNNGAPNKKMSYISWMAIFLFVILLSWYMPAYDANKLVLPYSELNAQIKADEIAEVNLKGGLVQGKLKDGRSFESYVPDDSGIVAELKQKNVKITAEPVQDDEMSFGSALISWLPMLLFIGI